MSTIPRMVVAPIARVARNMPFVPSSLPTSPKHLLTPAVLAVTAALQRLDLSRDPRKTVAKAKAHKPTLADLAQWSLMAAVWAYTLWIMPSVPLKLLIVTSWSIAVAIPLTSQFVWPATPVLTWVVMFFCARYVPTSSRPGIHVALLPALESVMYGANISDLQTRFTHPLLDILAWLPYGVLHFALPVVVAIFLWVFGPRGSVQFWGKAFGFMNLFGVITQILLPCSAPWYELIHGLTPANYGMPGSPGGLLRIDRFFHSSGYTNTFGNAPLVFGAFPSLHSGCAVMEALFLSHFFPFLKPLYWGYVGILWWATMYLSHHYLFDLSGGACLSVLVFYLFMPLEFRDIDGLKWSQGEGYEMVTTAPDAARDRDVDFDEEIRKLEDGGGSGEADEEAAIEGNEAESSAGGARNKRSVSWGETKVLGEDAH